MSGDALRFLEHIAGDYDAGWIEIRPSDGGRWRQDVRHWFSPDNLEAAADHALSLSDVFDVYVGMAPRDCHGGENKDVSRAYVVSADCDSDDALEALERFSALDGGDL